ncbi:MAG TPA: hypothetical protein VEY51_14330 [Chondromyces sp.]|nr:hypothetical protein [Chondromyces sp.]
MNTNEEVNIVQELQLCASDQMANAQNLMEVARAIEQQGMNEELLEKIQVLSDESRQLYNQSLRLEERLLENK